MRTGARLPMGGLWLLWVLVLWSENAGSGTCAMETHGTSPLSRINATIAAVLGQQREETRGVANAPAGKNAAYKKSGAASGKQALGTNATGQAPAAARIQQQPGVGVGVGGGVGGTRPIAQAQSQAHFPHAVSEFGYPMLTKGHQLQNITVMHEKISAPARSGGRWDSGGGQAIDTALKDDGPKQLQTAMMVLATVAGSFICGGAGIVACCWQGREKGWSSAAKQETKDKFKGSGAQWLEMPV